ncbi:ZIP family metal transporter [Vulcanococcus sp.]|uniref:ZIP family metal transporter n=1 Tax=Vulcanococcus sp. TaxID=2856995 RepID=UPI003C096B8C
MAALSSFPALLLGSGLMSLIALVGAITLVLPPAWLNRLLLPLIALAAGSLLGGALFHMLPEAWSSSDPQHAGAWVAAGFAAFLALEEFLLWHHSHRQNTSTDSRRPTGVLILLGDGLHNFIGGLGIASTYLINPQAGVAAWLAAVAHEIPQELGDFGVLVHSGWRPRAALSWNVLSALSFPLGSLLAWTLRERIPLAPLVLFAAGNFIYIAASDLVPEIKSGRKLSQSLLCYAWFTAGLLLLWSLGHQAS